MKAILSLESSSQDLASLEAACRDGLRETELEIVSHVRRSSLSGDTVNVLVVAAEIGGALALNIVASFLYDLLKAGLVKAKVDGREVKGDSAADVTRQLTEIRDDKDHAP